MSSQAPGVADQSTDIEWMWQSNPDPWSKTQKPEWSHYSDVENVIIEKAFSTKKSHAIMDGYCIDFKHRVQISDSDKEKQRPVRRAVCNKEETHLRQERFMPDPIAPRRPFGGQYGWISPFIIEVRSSLNLERKQLPSTNKNIVPMIVEKAALGIIEEGKLIGKRREAEEMAEQLMVQRNQGIMEVWKCCARLYSLESFLYKKLNEAMRLIGSEEQEEVWRSKIRTLGPFCLLLWDNPFNKKISKNIQLFRGANLTPEQITTYQDLSTRPKEYRSFQAFTSCSRNRPLAENFANANVLFIMEVEYAFTVDLSPISRYPEEAEELVNPGVCFSVHRVEFDKHKKKHLIYLKLRQRYASELDRFFRNLCDMLSIRIQIRFIANLSLIKGNLFRILTLRVISGLNERNHETHS
jgi:hypothetical protein